MKGFNQKMSMSIPMLQDIPGMYKDIIVRLFIIEKKYGEWPLATDRKIDFKNCVISQSEISHRNKVMNDISSHWMNHRSILSEKSISLKKKKKILCYHIHNVKKNQMK